MLAPFFPLRSRYNRSMFEFIDESLQSVREAFSDTEGLPPGSQSPVQAGGLTADMSEDSPLAGVGQFLGDWGRGIDQEGWTSIFDPFGAVDRQEAQRELADRFQVVDDTEGRAAENQVTQEQFQEIARTYSNIRMGRSDIDFNTEGLDEEQAAAYRAGTMDDLASIMQTEGGRTLVNRLANNENDHTTTLSPLFQKNEDGEYDPSLGRDNTNGFASPQGNRSDRFRVDEDTPGEGVDSRVRYNPGVDIAPADADLTQDQWLPWRSDVLLYHELVHSMDHTYGTMDPDRIGADGDGAIDSESGEAYDAGGKRSEHRAAGLGIYADEAISENAYRAARRDIGATGVGERVGDDTMPDRDTYFYHSAPAPAPDGSSSSGTTRRDPHGHVHDDDEHHHHH